MNLGENNNFFRESFRGFNKDDVAEYIAKLSKDYSANEEKYKELIAKLAAEVKAKTEEIENLESGRENTGVSAESMVVSLEEIESKYKDEINRLVSELNERDVKIINLQSVQDEEKAADNVPSIAPEELAELKEEIMKAKETIYELSKEIEELRERCEAAESREVPEPDSKTINQLSFQLAECESEKLFLFNLLKKFIFMLGTESSKNKNIENIAVLSDIGSKAAVSGEIEAGLNALLQLKDKIAELEAENAGLKDKIANAPAMVATEQEMYKAVMSKLGDTVYSANKSAEEIVAKAKAEAEDIINGIKTEADNIIGGANAKRTGIIEENKKIMADFKEKYEFIKSEHESMVQKYKETSGKYALRLSELEDTINVIYDTVINEDSDG